MLQSVRTAGSIADSDRVVNASAASRLGRLGRLPRGTTSHYGLNHLFRRGGDAQVPDAWLFRRRPLLPPCSECSEIWCVSGDLWCVSGVTALPYMVPLRWAEGGFADGAEAGVEGVDLEAEGFEVVLGTAEEGGVRGGCAAEGVEAGADAGDEGGGGPEGAGVGLVGGEVGVVVDAGLGVVVGAERRDVVAVAEGGDEVDGAGDERFRVGGIGGGLDEFDADGVEVCALAIGAGARRARRRGARGRRWRGGRRGPTM